MPKFVVPRAMQTKKECEKKFEGHLLYTFSFLVPLELELFGANKASQLHSQERSSPQSPQPTQRSKHDTFQQKCNLHDLTVGRKTAVVSAAEKPKIKQNKKHFKNGNTKLELTKHVCRLAIGTSCANMFAIIILFLNDQ